MPKVSLASSPFWTATVVHALGSGAHAASVGRAFEQDASEHARRLKELVDTGILFRRGYEGGFRHEANWSWFLRQAWSEFKARAKNLDAGALVLAEKKWLEDEEFAVFYRGVTKQECKRLAGRPLVGFDAAFVNPVIRLIDLAPLFDLAFAQGGRKLQREVINDNADGDEEVHAAWKLFADARFRKKLRFFREFDKSAPSFCKLALKTIEGE